MCSGCFYENYFGECTRPYGEPCPDSEEDVDAWEESQQYLEDVWMDHFHDDTEDEC